MMKGWKQKENGRKTVRKTGWKGGKVSVEGLEIKEKRKTDDRIRKKKNWHAGNRK